MCSGTPLIQASFGQKKLDCRVANMTFGKGIYVRCPHFSES